MGKDKSNAEKYLPWARFLLTLSAIAFAAIIAWSQVKNTVDSNEVAVKELKEKQQAISDTLLEKDEFKTWVEKHTANYEKFVESQNEAMEVVKDSIVEIEKKNIATKKDLESIFKLLIRIEKAVNEK